MNFKKTSAALMAAAVLAVAAPTVGLMPATTAYADVVTTENGITIKTDAKNAKYGSFDTLYNDWRNTFEISCSNEAFQNGGTEIAINYVISYLEGMDAVAEISWDCDAYIWDMNWSLYGVYNPETNEFDRNGMGGGEPDAYEILDGDIAQFGDIDFIQYHLGSKNGEDYVGAGKGVVALPLTGKVAEDSIYYDSNLNSHTFDGIYISFNEPGTVTISIKERTASTEPTTPVDPTVSTKEQSFHDDTTDISVSGSFPEGTALKTETKQTSETKVSWDITLVDADGNKIQPNGTATVRVPLPEAFKGKDVFVYRIEDGKYTALESNVEGDYIVFKTNHFSEYVLTTEKVEEKPEANPNTGVSAAAAFGVIALAGAFAIVSRKKR